MIGRRTALWYVGGLIAIGLAAAATVALRGSAAAAGATDQSSVPTTRVVRGALELSVHGKGDLRASKFASLQAPPMSGTLRLLTIVETGVHVKQGDVIMTFDPTELQYQLEQAESQLAEAEQNIIKFEADRDAQAAQDTFDLLQAGFDLRRAELDAKPDRDLISERDYETHQITLEEARKKLAKLQGSGSSRAETDRAALAVAQEKRAEAKNTADRARESLDHLVMKAPMDGFVVVSQNQDANNGFFYSGMTLPEYRAGDVVFPGRPVADVFDISTMEIKAKVNEQQRNNLATGQTATVAADELSGVPLTAKITAVSGLAQEDFWSMSGPLRDFDVTLQLDHADPRLRPGTSVALVMAGTRVENVLHVPRQAIFEKAGKPVVYVRRGNRFEATAVKPTHRTETRVAIEGLAEGTEVALVNPDLAAKPAQAAPPPTGVGR
ncbi:MAG TPA: HlyD family efflux transporter periplasmic adaptor subunit [Vicinamibacterales bacterium]